MIRRVTIGAMGGVAGRGRNGGGAGSESPCVILGETGRDNQSCTIVGGRGSRPAGALSRFSARRVPRPPGITKPYLAQARLPPSRRAEPVLGSAGAPRPPETRNPVQQLLISCFISRTACCMPTITARATML